MQKTPYFGLNLPEGTDRVDIEALNENSEVIDTAMAQIRTKAEAPVYYNQVIDTPEELPASDVYPWAKTDKKPVYSAYEVGAYSQAEINAQVSNLQQEIDEISGSTSDDPIPIELIKSLFDDPID